MQNKSIEDEERKQRFSKSSFEIEIRISGRVRHSSEGRIILVASLQGAHEKPHANWNAGGVGGETEALYGF